MAREGARGLGWVGGAGPKGILDATGGAVEVMDASRRAVDTRIGMRIEILPFGTKTKLPGRCIDVDLIVLRRRAFARSRSAQALASGDVTLARVPNELSAGTYQCAARDGRCRRSSGIRLFLVPSYCFLAHLALGCPFPYPQHNSTRLAHQPPCRRVKESPPTPSCASRSRTRSSRRPTKTAAARAR
jgi:hypothetical protein